MKPQAHEPPPTSVEGLPDKQREASPEEANRVFVDRALRARIAAGERWARTGDRRSATEPARRGLRRKFEREVDPEHVLEPAELACRADHLQRAHMMRMSLAAAKKRRRRGARRLS